MYTIKKWLALVVLFATAGSVSAQGIDTASYTFSLKQAVDYGLQQQSSVKNAAIDEKIAQYKVWEIAGIGMPQLSSSFDFKDYLEIPTSFIPGEFFGGPAGSFIPVKFGTQYSATAGLSASQLIFDGSYIVGLQATKVYLELAQKQSQRSKTEATVNITKAYYTALVSAEQMALLQANIDRLKKLMDDTKALNDNGFVEKLDLDRVTLAYNNLVTEKDKVQRLLDLGMGLLKYQMGMDQSAKLTLTDKLADVSFQPAASTADKFDYKNRVEYGMLMLQQEGNTLQLRKDYFSRLPSIAAYGALQANAQRNKFDFLDNVSQRWYPIGIIGLQVNLPLFSGLSNNWRIQQDKLQLEKTKNDVQFLERSIDLDLTSARTKLQNASVSLEMQKKNSELAESVYRDAKKKYDSGIGSNLEVLNAQTSLKEAQTNYFNALYDAVVAKVDFDKASGNIK